MSERWELDSADKRGTFFISAYKPGYVMPFLWSSSPNRQPQSENSANSLLAPVNYDPVEAAFQLSFKSKIVQGIFKGYGDIWVAYSQKAIWQVYNGKISRPFREINSEPEIMLNVATKLSLFGFKLRMFGASLNHQSNGKSLPLSRSWNRVIFFAGIEKRSLQFYLRHWIRIPDSNDENPEILNYYGRMELVAIKNYKRNQFSITATNSLRFDIQNHGSILASWGFPVYKNLRSQLQVGHGYGSSMIDYNHNQTTIGLAISFIDW